MSIILHILCIIAGIPYKSPSNCGFFSCSESTSILPVPLGDIFFEVIRAPSNFKHCHRRRFRGSAQPVSVFLFLPTCGATRVWKPCLVTKSRKTFTPPILERWWRFRCLKTVFFFFFFRRCVVDEDGQVEGSCLSESSCKWFGHVSAAFNRLRPKTTWQFISKFSRASTFPYWFSGPFP